MHVLKVLFMKYKAGFVKLVAVLGPWSVFVVAFLDSCATTGIPIDVLLVGLVAKWPGMALPLAGLASLGSALGSLIIYAIGRKGGEIALQKRVSQQKIDHLRATFEKREFLALMVPSMLPPPTPFKLFVLASGVFCMKIRDFLLAILIGRMVRFSILALLTAKYGPQILDTAKNLLKQHLGFTLAGVLALLLVIWLIIRAWKEPVAELAHELEEAETKA